ncbi:bifunctional 3-(3-hydroxy-phenyl)propionate/3-hydroxycinnamic acid hydroxylase [Acinetobacter wuhouensis]|uniref:Bifunctional 3-(3-hydroxy-phenyl)propionate/3-hydroxycinnamic acid hydroxylase n=1 Tax=Acinetobacter wuhouensis TaxID=1879050 RepID=A0A4Q7AFE8_9GAMM|nr:bifunctional 3-(3-hydroxy-phenyl)propionate/3-hydroxycinnamic acid hydroxylase [Acinetobacter wuhouensis]RZG45321.1 bifunctional 3-(3-hydroxy-phenyl)propionate/3-hydroxycinnamic acid hydroxylase [Acinetobacter wuhouensis]
MEQSNHNFDVIISGFGPVGSVLAIFLARQGHKVAIFERWTERYPLPRAVCIDHEMLRMLRTLNLDHKLNDIIHAGGTYDWVNSNWQPLVKVDWGAATISQESNVNFVHQPSLEKILEEEIKTMPNIQLFLGYEVLEVGQEEEGVYLSAQNVETQNVKTFYAQYLVGADGANSLIRQSITSQWIDKGFEADWLVVDVLPHNPDDLKIKGTAAVQYCNPKRPTTIVPAGKKEGRYFRRWEFMRLPHETKEEMQTEAKAWELLSDWIKPENATLIRSAMYTFRSLIAERWRNQRILIAGDACHVMPPFMGQGMCAGFRDAWNLSWKLDGVLKDNYSANILETYTRERKPHVEDVIDLSMYMGRIICVPDEEKAQQRDEKFLNGTAEPMPEFPILTDGLISRTAKLNTLAGHIAPHGIFNIDGTETRLDQIVKQQFVLLTSKTIELSHDDTEILEQLNCKVVSIKHNDEITENGYQEQDDNIYNFMNEHNVQGVLVRPDFYIYGTAKQIAEVSALLKNLVQDLAQYTLIEAAT